MQSADRDVPKLTKTFFQKTSHDRMSWPGTASTCVSRCRCRSSAPRVCHLAAPPVNVEAPGAGTRVPVFVATAMTPCSSPNPPGPREAQGRTLGRRPLAAPENGFLPLPGPAVLLAAARAAACVRCVRCVASPPPAGSKVSGRSRRAAHGSRQLPGRSAEAGPSSLLEMQSLGPRGPRCGRRACSQHLRGVCVHPEIQKLCSRAQLTALLLSPFIPNPSVLATHGVILHSEDRPRLPTRPHHVLL